MKFPLVRLRRLRKSFNIRQMVKETELHLNDLVMPYFVLHGKGIKRPVSSMPGIEQFSIDTLIKDIQETYKSGIAGVLLFGIPDKKDSKATQAYSETGIIQQAVRSIKDKIPDMVVMTDLCFCEYTDHGHCGIIKNKQLNNDATLELIGRTAISQAEAGADIIAPSCMIDGMVKTIRENLDIEGFTDTIIMSYSAKYASNFYGPFREAAESPPKFGDRKTYQMDFANSDEALREVKLDINEGADIVMVKPALAYLDVIYRVKKEFKHPVAAYNVSGEYTMLKYAIEKKWLNENVILETLTSIKRAGADIILTYFAKDLAKKI